MNLMNRLLQTCRRKWLLLLGVLVGAILLATSMFPSDFNLVNLLSKNP